MRSGVILGKKEIETLLGRSTDLPEHYTLDTLYSDLRACATDETIDRVERLIVRFHLFYSALDELFVCTRNVAQSWQDDAIRLGYGKVIEEEEDA